MKRKKGKHGRKKSTGSIDWMLVVIVAILIAFGIVMLYSASSYTSRIDHDGDSFYYVKKQLFSTAVGFVAMALVAIVPREFIVKLTPAAAVLAGLSVLMVYTPLGIESHGAKRWISLGFFSFQPAEAVKIAVILLTALLLCKFKARLEDLKIYFKVMAGTFAAALLIAFVTDDLGTTIIIFFVGMIMAFLASKHVKNMLITIAVAVVGGVIYVISSSFRMERIMTWLDIESYVTDEGYQIMQGLYAIGSGGFLGKGLGKSTQKMGFVPESQNDMIFSIICEELGIIGGIIILGLFAYLVWRMKKTYDGIAASDKWGRLVVAGVASHIALQTIINMSVVTNLIPNTGVPLPFISYGGSSIIFTLAEIGLVLNISREMKREIV